MENSREHIYRQLTLQPIRSPNHEWLACMVASWCVGKGVLPDYLGLEPQDFIALKKHYFENYPLLPQAISKKTLDFSRMLERDDLVQLLKQNARSNVVEIDWIIGLVVAGCLGDEHLWHDLGLWSRSQLTALLHYNFPALAERNIHDMKWKKFIYKQLCEAEGLYLCRAPSCAECADHQLCYGNEELAIDS